MKRMLRLIVSVFIAFELLFASLLAGGSLRVSLPGADAPQNNGWVNAFIGTGGIPWMCGMLSPAAQTPFGAVRLGPDTSAVGGVGVNIKTNTSGYYYEHRHMLGFSMSRLSGTGARDYGMFRVTPAAGTWRGGALAYSHNDETAAPGYYAVYLPGAAALCEMTAAAHTGLQRYTFTTEKDALLYLDAVSSVSGDGALHGKIEVDPANRSLTAQSLLDGTFSGRYGGLTVYLYAEWDKDVAAVTAYTAAGNAPGTVAEGETAGVLLNFGNQKDNSVTLKMGISFISTDNARENLRAEAGERSFEQLRAAAADEWAERLSAIEIEADDETKQIFYTALYRAMLMPTDFTDVGGRYLGFDGAVHTADGYTYRTDMSLWDTCRNVHSLYTLIAPEIQTDCLSSLLAMAQQGGTLPRWPSGAGYTGSMFGNPANIVFAESYLKGVEFDAAQAYSYIKLASETEFAHKDSRDGAVLYNEYGYLPNDLIKDDSVSKTLEYAWEDAAAAVLAEALGRTEDAAVFAARAQNYRNLWNAENRYFCPRNADGSFEAIFPYMTSFFDDVFSTKLFRAYCEGSARQWRWSVQQDINGLISLFGSPETFVKELEAFMRDAAPTRAGIDPGAGYWIGNQHDIHTPYLFSNAGRADLTQKWVRWTLKNRFSTDPDGLDGNDDGGTLSCWYVFSALGFYPLAGTDRYWIGSPCVSGAKINLPGGKTLTVTAKNQSDRNIYVAAVTLNGEPLAGPYITHAALMGGGELVFEMTDRPVG